MPTVRFILTLLVLAAVTWQLAVWSGDSGRPAAVRYDQPPGVRESMAAVMRARTPEAAEAAGVRLHAALAVAGETPGGFGDSSE